MDEDLVVVNKPPSIPVHPIGRFRVSPLLTPTMYMYTHLRGVYTSLFSVDVPTEELGRDDPE